MMKLKGHLIKSIVLSIILVPFVVFFFSSPGYTWNQSMFLNFASTGFLDGFLAYGPPGFYQNVYIKHYHAEKFKGQHIAGYTINPKRWFPFYSSDGDDNWKRPDTGFTRSSQDRIDVTAIGIQLVYISPWSLWRKKNGFTPGFQIFLPLYSYNMDSDVFDYIEDQSGRDPIGESGLGDLCIGPILRFPVFNIGPVKVYSFFEFDVWMPTGRYNEDKMINPGANLWTFEPYYAFTLMFPHGFSLSMRHHYTYNTENHDYHMPIVNLNTGRLEWHQLDMQPGQMYHFNYVISKQIGKNPFNRIGIAGYYIKQLTEDEIEDKDVDDSEEEAFSIGPAISYRTKSGIFLTLKALFDVHAENRPKGEMFVWRIVYKW